MRTIRINERELTYLIKRIIKEQKTEDGGFGKSIEECYENVPMRYHVIIDMFLDACNNFERWESSNWDESKITDAFLLIKTQQDMNELNKYLLCFVESGAHEPGEFSSVTDVLKEIYIWAFDKVTDVLDDKFKQKIKDHFRRNSLRFKI